MEFTNEDIKSLFDIVKYIRNNYKPDLSDISAHFLLTPSKAKMLCDVLICANVIYLQSNELGEYYLVL
jgi:DNA-binding MarR family transcriptional regulator